MAVIVVLDIHRHSFCICERPILSQITQMIADKPQNNKTALTSPTCLSLRNDAACCIPLRDLRYLRENIHMRVLQQSTQTKPQKSPADHADYADKNPTTTTTTTTTAFSLRPLRENKRAN